jgi:hypothetical protein
VLLQRQKRRQKARDVGQKVQRLGEAMAIDHAGEQEQGPGRKGQRFRGGPRRQMQFPRAGGLPGHKLGAAEQRGHPRKRSGGRRGHRHAAVSQVARDRGRTGKAAVAGLDHQLRRPLGNDPPSPLPALGPQVDDPVGALYHVQVVLDHQHCAAAGATSPLRRGRWRRVCFRCGRRCNWGGNVTAAARALAVHRTQLRRWIERHGIDPRQC